MGRGSDYNVSRYDLAVSLSTPSPGVYLALTSPISGLDPYYYCLIRARHT